MIGGEPPEDHDRTGPCPQHAAEHEREHHLGAAASARDRDKAVGHHDKAGKRDHIQQLSGLQRNAHHQCDEIGQRKLQRHPQHIDGARLDDHLFVLRQFLDLAGKAGKLKVPPLKRLFPIFDQMQLRQQIDHDCAQLHIHFREQRHRIQCRDDGQVDQISDQDQIEPAALRAVIAKLKQEEHRDIDHHRGLIHDEVRPQQRRAVADLDPLLFQDIGLRELTAGGAGRDARKKAAHERDDRAVNEPIVFPIPPAQHLIDPSDDQRVDDAPCHDDQQEIPRHFRDEPQDLLIIVLQGKPYRKYGDDDDQKQIQRILLSLFHRITFISFPPSAAFLIYYIHSKQAAISKPDAFASH